MKRKLIKRRINLVVMENNIKKYMREHPIYGEEYKREERLNEMIEGKPRIFKPRMISR